MKNGISDKDKIVTKDNTKSEIERLNKKIMELEIHLSNTDTILEMIASEVSQNNLYLKYLVQLFNFQTPKN